MNPDVKERWVAALRSGEYKQAESKLKHPWRDEFCCLGVLCEISGLGDWGPCTTNDSHRYFVGGMPVAGWVNSHDPVGRWAGFGADDYREPMFMNDRGASFSEIADYIEENL